MLVTYMKKLSVWSMFCVVLWDHKLSLRQDQGVGEEERSGGQNGAIIPGYFIADSFNFGHRIT